MLFHFVSVQSDPPSPLFSLHKVLFCPCDLPYISHESTEILHSFLLATFPLSILIILYHQSERYFTVHHPCNQEFITETHWEPFFFLLLLYQPFFGLNFLFPLFPLSQGTLNHFRLQQKHVLFSLLILYSDRRLHCTVYTLCISAHKINFFSFIHGLQWHIPADIVQISMHMLGHCAYFIFIFTI